MTGTLTSVLVARALGPTFLGRYQFVVWMAAIVATLSMYGVPVAANRNLAAYLVTGEFGLAGALVRRTLQIQAAIAGIVLAVGLTMVFVVLAPAERLFGVLAFITIIPTLLMAVPSGINTLDDKYRGNAIPSIVDGVVACLGTAFVLWMHLGLVGLAAATLLARLMDSGLRFWMARHRLRDLLRHATSLPLVESAKFNRMAREAALMQLLAFVVWNRSEIFFLRIFSTDAQIAFFSLAFGFAFKPGLFSGTAARVFDPAILRTYHVDKRAAVRLVAHSARIQAFISYPLFFAFAIIASPAIILLYRAQYLPAIPMVVVLTIATATQSGRVALEMLLQAADRQRQMVVVYLGVSVLTLLLDWVLIQRYDGMGASIANGTIQLVQAGWVLALAMRYTSLRWRDLALGKPFLLAAASAAPAWLLTREWSPVPALTVRPLLVALLFGVGVWLMNRLGWITPEERALVVDGWNWLRHAPQRLIVGRGVVPFQAVAEGFIPPPASRAPSPRTERDGGQSAPRIVIVAWHFPPSTEVAGKAISRFAAGLALGGADVRILTPPAAEARARDETYTPSAALRIIRVPAWPDLIARAARILNAVRRPAGLRAQSKSSTNEPGRFSIRWLVLTVAHLPDPANRWIVPASRALRRELEREPADLVITCAPNFSAHLVAKRVGLPRPGTAWFAWSHDPLADNPYSTESPAWRTRLLRYWEESVVTRATRVLVTTAELAAEFNRLFPSILAPAIVPCGYEVDRFPGASPVAGPLTISHVGTLYGHRTPVPLLETVARLRDAGYFDPGTLQLRFVGNASDLEGESLAAVVERLGLQDMVTVSPPVSQHEALRLIRESGVGLILAENQPVQVPAKTFEYIGLRRPVLALADGATAALVRQLGVGVACDRDGLGAALLQLRREWSEDRLAAYQPALDAAAGQYAAAKLAEDVLELLAGLPHA